VFDQARHLIRAVQILVADGRIPKPLRGLAAVGVLPIPGPVDEVVLLIAGVLLWAFYRDCLREAWSQTAPNLAGDVHG
jgi:glycogen debranching enzyme